MKLILHIGMGKTGSSSIQHALSQSGETLRAQKAKYLGMWFDMIDPAFRGLANQNRFFKQAPDAMRQHARTLQRLLARYADSEGIEVFVMSNEAFSGNSTALLPFVEELQQTVAVHAIAYARSPFTWLPSAYTQWSIRDKTDLGPIPSYEEKAPVLVGWYRGLIAWSDLMGDILEVRHYDMVDDVVRDFAEVTGLALTIGQERSLERGEDTEMLLRALFNNRFPQAVLPNYFDRAVIGKTVEFSRLSELLDKYLNYTKTDEIINNNRKLFEQYHERFDINLLSGEHACPAKPDNEEFRQRLFDYIVEITLEQARRIARLEKQIASLTKKDAAE